MPEHLGAVHAFYRSEAESYTPILESLAVLLEREVLPRSSQFDLRPGGLSEARKAVFDQGVCQIASASHGGMSLPFGLYALAMELVGSADAATAMSIGIHNTAAEGIGAFGTEAQKQLFLPDLLSGRRLAAFALTEPSSGSDAKAMRTTARPKEGGASSYVINGSKMFITNAGEADLLLVFTRTENGHAAFIVESSNPGVDVGPDIPKLGMRGSRTAEVTFHDCEVPADSLVGRDGMAFEYAKPLLSASRIVMGAICVGVARMALQKAVEYSGQRRLFDERLADLQMTREKIADSRSEITASRMLYLYASSLRERGADFTSEAAQAKITASESAVRVCDRALQMFGGYGYTNPDVHRHWRDVRLLTIGEGASEVLRLLVASRELGGLAQ